MPAPPPDPGPRDAALPPLPLAFRLLLPWFRRELPMWARLYALAGGNRDECWRGRGVATVRGKLHGYTMALDLANWSERLTFCLARYHDLPIQHVLRQALRPGDCFVDVGANLGMLSLLAHRLVGEAGRVLACEPNPRLRSRIESAVRANGLLRLELVAKALGEHPGTAELREYAGHTGWGSLSATGPDGAAATAVWQVPVVPGDEVLAGVAAEQPIVVKIDVEGFEVPVLRGLKRTLDRWPLVMVEVADAHQRRAGFSAAQLRALLEQRGYRGFAMLAVRRLGFGRRVELVPLDRCHVPEVDAVFVPPRGPLVVRLPLPPG